MRKIHCHSCGVYLGELRDATLRKGVRFECSSCSSRNALKDELTFTHGQQDMLNRFKKGFGFK